MSTLAKGDLRALLLASDRAVERAMLALYQRQTSDERSSSCTTHANGQGFSAFHAKAGTRYAKWIKQGNRLTGTHLASARKMALHYLGQLLEVAQGGNKYATVTLNHDGSETSKAHAMQQAIRYHDPFQRAA